MPGQNISKHDKNEKISITIIMPSCNVANYIRKCMESVLAQNFVDLEILAIDAMSDDGTWEILMEYAAKDDRICILRSERKSYGYQVNLGIREAKGTYIGIVETDDLIDPEKYMLLCNKACELNLDYVKGNGKNYVQVANDAYYNSNLERYEKWGIEGKIINPSEYPELIYKDRFLWLGLYKTSFLRENRISLSETDGAAYQDIGFQIQILRSAKSAAYFDIPVYYYRHDNSDASGYSHNAFSYLAYEYRKLISESDEWNENQRKSLLVKLAMQYMHRYHIMAVSGRFWRETEEDMEIIRRWIIGAFDKGILQDTDFDEDLSRRIKVLSVGVRENYGCYLIDYLRFLDPVRNWVMELRERLSDSGKIVIFGCGLNGRYLRCFMEHLIPGSVIAFCDNDFSNSKKNVLGIKVMTPENAAKEYKTAVYLIPAGRFEEDMCRQISGLGIREELIVTYPFGRNMELLTTDVRSLM